jgi:hypothetical protein
MATLKCSEDIYDPKTYSIKAQVLWERVRFVAEYYPPELCHIIRMMTEFGILFIKNIFYFFLKLKIIL